MESIKRVLTRSGKIYPSCTWSISSITVFQLFMQFWKLMFGFINVSKMRSVQKRVSACVHVHTCVGTRVFPEYTAEVVHRGKNQVAAIDPHVGSHVKNVTTAQITGEVALVPKWGQPRSFRS